MNTKTLKTNFKNKPNLDGGFTVLETLVAIAVLILSLTAAFSVVQSSLSISMSARDEVTAYYLAQEGIEMIRNMRDENSLYDPVRPWLTGIAGAQSDPCYFGNYCAVDSPNKVFVSCGVEAGGCPVLRQDRDSNSLTFGMYGLDSTWDETVFKREMFLEQINSNEIALTITIYWTKGSLTRQFIIHENLFNWQK